MKYMVYDNEGATLDRYTIFPRDKEWDAQARKITPHCYFYCVTKHV